MDLSARLRAIVRPGPPKPALPRELTYEPDLAGFEVRARPPTGCRPPERAARRTVVSTPFGQCLVVDRRYESDRWHGDIRIGDCELRGRRGARDARPGAGAGRPRRAAAAGAGERSVAQVLSRTIFIDLETTGLSGGAGTVAFLVGLGFFDLGAFQVRQFLLTSHAAERALLAAVSECFEAWT